MGKKKISERTTSDLGTDELRQHTEIKEELNEENKRRVRNVLQIPLDYYHRIGLTTEGGISFRQWEAGTRLHKDFSLTGTTPTPQPISSDIFIKSTGPKDYTPSQWEAQRRFREAMKHIGRPDSPAYILLVNVCCYGYLLKDIRTVPYYVTTNQMMGRLCEALDSLADHYGIPFYPIAPKPQKKPFAK